MKSYRDEVEHIFTRLRHLHASHAGATLLSFLILSCSTALPGRAQTLLGNGDAADSFGARNFVELDGSLYFTASSFTALGSIWKSDGTPANTQPYFAPPRAGLETPPYLMSTGSILAFIAESEDEDTSDLWTSDGTAGGTAKRFIGLDGDHDPEERVVSSIAGVGNRIIAFKRPWVFSLDVATGDTTNIIYAPVDIEFIQARDFVYLFAETFRPTTQGLLRTDGTVSGTILLNSELQAEPEYVGINGNQLVALPDKTDEDRELFVSDGTVAGSMFLPEIIPGDENIQCDDLITIGDMSYFGVDDPNSINCIPYQTDGTAAGTKPVADTAGPLTRGFGANSEFVFWTSGQGELWRSDGTTAGTLMIDDYGSMGSNLVSFNNNVYFVVVDLSTVTTALWQSDGTVAGTMSIFDAPGGQSTPIDGLRMRVVGDRLYFSAFKTYYVQGVATGVDVQESLHRFELSAYPNPFRDHVTIKMVENETVNSFSVDTGSGASLTVIDLLGREVAEPVVGSRFESVRIDLSGLSSGVYFVKVTSGNSTAVKKIIRM